VQFGTLFCPTKKQALQKNGNLVFGVEKIGKGYVTTATGVWFDGVKKVYTATGNLQNHEYTRFRDTWYSLSG
jgi:hypothetical protein